MFTSCLESCKSDSLANKSLSFGNIILKLTNILGSGSYGNIYNTTNPNYVVKHVQTSFQESFEATVKEIKILFQFRKVPSILPCHGAIFDNFFTNNPNTIPKQADNIYILITKCIKAPLTSKSIAQIAGALSYMHIQQISHRDVKIENIVSLDNQAILIDFGSVSTYQIDQMRLLTDKNYYARVRDEIEAQTTPQYRAPELINLYSRLEITPKIDVFALGVVAFYISRAEMPFVEGEILSNFNYKFQQKGDSFLERLISRMLVKDVAARADIFEICRMCEAEFGQKFGVQEGAENQIQSQMPPIVENVEIPIQSESDTQSDSINQLVQSIRDNTDFRQIFSKIHTGGDFIQAVLSFDGVENSYCRAAIGLFSCLSQKQSAAIDNFTIFLLRIKNEFITSGKDLELEQLFYYVNYVRQIVILHNIIVEEQNSKILLQQVQYCIPSTIRVLQMRNQYIRNIVGRIAGSGIKLIVKSLINLEKEYSQEANDIYQQIFDHFNDFKEFCDIKFDLNSELK